jgi:hypothetical protein
MMLEYSELAADLERIRRFLAGNTETRQTADQRRFAYIACISALYSSFESFAERVIFSFSKKMLADRAMLSSDQISGLRRRYVRNASQLLGQNLGVGRYRDVTDLDVAKSLSSCLDDSGSLMDLRLEVIALHASNLRWDSLAELFRWAVPDLRVMIRNSDSIEGWMSNFVDVGEDAIDTILASELNDLVERRNEVAHRAIPDDILSYENLLAKVDYIEAISLGLVASLAGLVLEGAVKAGKSVSIGMPTEYYRKGRVVVIPSLESAVSEGDFVLASAKNSTRWGRIVEVRLNDQRVDRAPAGAEAGLLLDFAARRRATLHALHDPDLDIAAPPHGIFGDHGPLASQRFA